MDYKIKIVQCNIDRSKNSLQEFTRYFMGSDHLFALVSEPYTGTQDCVKTVPGMEIIQFSGTGRVKACIWAKSSPSSPSIIGVSQYSTTNLCVAKLTIGARPIYLASVYVEPDDAGEETLGHIELFLNTINGAKCVIGGDFNGWHPIWGSAKTNKRGNSIVEIMYSNDMFCCNTGCTPTFETVTHGRDRSSIIDLTWTSPDLIDDIVEWRVNLEACASSQHNAVEYTLNIDRTYQPRQGNTSTFRYKTDKAHWANFKSALNAHMFNSDVMDKDVTTMDEGQLDHYIDSITDIIHAACSDTIPTRKGDGKYKPPWWSEELEARKQEVIRLHRELHAARRFALPMESLNQKYVELKAKYAEELRAASCANFRSFCELQDKETVWTMTNRLLKDSKPRRAPTTINTGRHFTSDSKDTAQELLNHFYADDGPDTQSRHFDLRRRTNDPTNTADDPQFTPAEVLEIIKKMNPKKAPGLDGLTSDICKNFAFAYPQLLTDLLNRCLELQYFPRKWKTAYVKIIPKPNKQDSTSLNSYRPIGLIPVFGKLLEKLFINRVTYAASKAGKLNPHQFGFRQQTNTTMAIDHALKIIRSAKAAGEQVLAVSLDIKAAFDNAWWPALFERLKRIQCPNNIFNLIRNYLSDREVILDYADVRVTKRMSKGCIQGSTCGPVLWNIILDELLDEELPTGCHIQAFADDVLLVAHAKDTDNLQQITNKALHIITQWGESVKLCFGPTKTKLITFTPKSKTAEITMAGEKLKFEKEIKLLGVTIDAKLLFNSHVNNVIGKATRIFNRLCLYCRPTWGAHPENVRIIYRQVIEPIVTYAAGIWGHVAQKKGVRRKLLSMQRGFAIKINKSFRTTSTIAAISLAQLTPLDLKVLEVHTVEKTRLTHTTDILPHDITLERPTPPHDLLHPADRITVLPLSFTNDEEIAEYTKSGSIIQLYTDGSKLEEGQVGAAFVHWENNRARATKKYKLHNSCSVFQAELLAIQKACSWAHAKYPGKSIQIFTDSQSSLAAIADRSNTQPMVTEIHKLMHETKCIIDIAWVKSHVGIAGNEAADMAAKQAATSHNQPAYSVFPISYVKRAIKTKHKQMWQNRYDSATQGRHTHQLLPKLQDIDDLFKITKRDFYLTQILTGHGYHREYLHRFGITEDETCPCDNSSTQTLKHLLECCPRFGYARMEHIFICENLGIDPFLITDLMRKISAIESFITYSTGIMKQLKFFNENNST